MTKRTILILLSVVLIVAGCYSFAWFEVYSLTSGYAREAAENLQEGKPALAVKGGLDFLTQEFTGGYQQVIEAWSTAGIFPVPEFYRDATQKISEILSGMTISEIDAMVKKYIKTDKKYLDTALLLKADLLLADGKKEEAVQLYQDLKELFPLNNALQDTITKKLEEIT